MSTTRWCPYQVLQMLKSPASMLTFTKVVVGCLWGNVINDSEQIVMGTSFAILDTPDNPPQRHDPGLNPMVLVPVSADLDTCEELMANRDTLFPHEPEF